MTPKLSKSVIGILAALGAIASIVTAYFRPSIFAPVLAATGGALTGASLVAEKKRQEQQSIAEASAVATAFSTLYENNKGLISAEQLSYSSHVDLGKINEFLGRLVEEQGGQLITTAKGPIYSFPHPTHVLTELTNNAQNWASAQQEQLLQQVGILQQRLTLIAAQQTAPKSQASGLLPQQSLNKNEINQTGIDPWNSLL